MTLAIKLSGVELAGDLPNINEFVLNLPTDGLVEAWRAYSGVEVSSGFVVDWEGWEGENATPGSGPVYHESIAETDRPSLRFSGAQYLASAVAPPAGGYLVMAYVPRALASSQLIGRQVDTNNRLMLGQNASNKVSGAVGNQSTSNLAGTTTVVAGTPLVVGMYVNGTTAKLRVNGVEEDSATFSGSTGTGPMWLGGVNNAGALGFAMNADIAAIAVYTGALAPEALSAIDTAMGKFVSLTI